VTKSVTSRKWWATSVLATAVVLGAAISVALAESSDHPLTQDDLDREPKAIGPAVVLQKGSTGGIDWTITAYDSDRGRCVDLTTSGAVSGSGGACGTGVPDEVAVSTVTDNFVAADRTFIYGEADEGVELVVLTLTDGNTIQVGESSFIDPAEFDTRFFVLPLSGVPEIETGVALNTDGVVLQTW
jgi:hypothetical protein